MLGNRGRENEGGARVFLQGSCLQSVLGLERDMCIIHVIVYQFDIVMLIIHCFLDTCVLASADHLLNFNDRKGRHEAVTLRVFLLVTRAPS